ncbi:hypothetical protein ACFQX7_02200 [Luedemannella flava]
MISEALSRPAALSSGRIRPSRPVRAPMSTTSAVSASLRRTLATSRVPRPAADAMARSDHSGYAAMMRSAARIRSGCDSGRPCAMLVRTARTNAS